MHTKTNNLFQAAYLVESAGILSGTAIKSFKSKNADLLLQEKTKSHDDLQACIDGLMRADDARSEKLLKQLDSLVMAGADLNQQVQASFDKKMTKEFPIIFMTATSHAAGLKTLLKSPFIQPNVFSQGIIKKFSPLGMALVNMSLEHIKILLADRRIDLDAATKEGVTAEGMVTSFYPYNLQSLVLSKEDNSKKIKEVRTLIPKIATMVAEEMQRRNAEEATSTTCECTIL